MHDDRQNKEQCYKITFAENRKELIFTHCIQKLIQPVLTENTNIVKSIRFWDTISLGIK